AAKPAKLVKHCQMSAPYNTTVLYPSKEDGRHCSYFRKSSRKGLLGVELDQLSGVKQSKITWLEEIQAPKNLVVRRGLYKGPTIRR
ncbi:hypothetical protein glysoja_049974, partial [Glycine soja]